MNRQKSLILLTLFALLLSILPVSAQDDEADITYFVTEDAAFATALLDGWVADGSREAGLYIASSGETMTLLTSDEDTAMPAGEYAIVVITGQIPTPDGLDFVSFLDNFADNIMDTGEFTISEEAYATEYADRIFARIDATNDMTDAIILAYEIAPNIWGVAFLLAAPGEGEALSELGFALVNTVSFSLPLDETIEGFFGTNYLVPETWVGNEFEGVFSAANSDDALEADKLESGQYRIALLEWDGADAEDTANTILSGSLTEDLHTNDPLMLTVGEQEVLQIAVRNEEELGVGGILVIEAPEGEPDLVAIYESFPGESHFVGLTALNMLVFGQVSAETE